TKPGRYAIAAREGPNPKLQAPKKLQISNPNTDVRNRSWSLVLGASLGFGAWSLGFLRRHVLAAALISSTVFVGRAAAAEVIPPKPTAYFNDYANVVPQDKARAMNEQLAQVERDT